MAPQLDTRDMPFSPTREQIAQIAELMHRRFGIELRGGKEVVFAKRLTRALRQPRTAGLNNFLARETEPWLLDQLADEVATHLTGFLREAEHFDLLRQRVLPRGKNHPIRLWSAAASTGEEAYTMAMLSAEELGDDAHQTVRILASDISLAVLTTGEIAAYRAAALTPLPEAWRRRYFLEGHREWEGWRRVRPELRSMVKFRRINLLEPDPGLPHFEAIFCRNVLIYFDTATRRRVMEFLMRKLAPGGLLILGHAEAGSPAPEPLELVCPSVWTLNPKRHVTSNRSRHQ